MTSLATPFPRARRTLLGLTLAIAATAPAAARDLHKCLNQENAVVYQDVPCKHMGYFRMAELKQFTTAGLDASDTMRRLRAGIEEYNERRAQEALLEERLQQARRLEANDLEMRRTVQDAVRESIEQNLHPVSLESR